MLDDLNQAAEQLGGRWVKITKKADGAVEGDIVHFEKRVKTFEGAPVYRRNTTDPRYEWVFTLKVDQLDGDDDDGLRKISVNESGQRAIAAAIRESGQKAGEGGRIKFAVLEDAPGDRDQAVYQAKYTPPAAGADAVAAIFGAVEETEPF